MTNNMIMLMETSRLMEEGVLKGSGVFVEVELAGEIKKIELAEEIHTYNGWKARGYQVKRGEKSDIKFPIWAYQEGKKVVEDGEEKQSGKCYMRMSAFFKADQVERIAG